ncbi:NAD(P)H-dependent glycerol-3-phosphate dehydrogenase [Aliikangiella coralliicola]|uniref:Glycerol-3-phosphate dehydrogenase [NAD(P)+] n=1 Tax=Aliikangiella coralliicola TaxID=2592383 RepID=A0A545UHD0_9GAMM|nr:NAD(P)H-dependent glycerol-3-phosphate dehydrogenase [Aliikangiella coralliicola]TQV88869.1 NAD(P)H-dependent glycerol-3-phosphate dehydrogenase [Aliikangiella coralliicola]
MSDILQKPIAVLGAGSFGTALAILLARNGNRTIFWGRDPEQIESMKEKRLNQKYLPNTPLPPNLEITSDFEKTIEVARDILVVTPSYAFSQTLNRIKSLTDDDVRIVWACKGLEPDSSDFLENRVIEIFGEDCPKAVLSGPTFAQELAVGSPTAITLAADDGQFAADLSQRLVNQTFRVYLSSDLKGVQFGGAFKNICAIGAGIADGLGFGANARTALVTRGLAEMMRMGEKLGGRIETFTGMAGLGDLVLTCTDNQSRNRRFGLALGKGASTEKAAAEIGQVVEGVRNTKEVRHLAELHEVDMPICQSIYNILYCDQDPKQAARELLTRAMKVEGD